MKFPGFGFWRKNKDADDEGLDEEGPLEDEADEIDAAAKSRSARTQPAPRPKDDGRGAGAGATAGGEAEDMADDVAARILASLPQVGDDLADEAPAEPPPRSERAAADEDSGRPAAGDDPDARRAPEGETELAGGGDDDPVFDDDDDLDDEAAGRQGGKRRLIVLAAAASVAVAAAGGGAWWFLAGDGGPPKPASSSGPRVEIMLPPPPGAPPPAALGPPGSSTSRDAAPVAAPAPSVAGAAATAAGGALAGAAPSSAPAAQAAPAATLAAGLAAPAPAPGAAQPGASLNTLAATLQGPGAGLVAPPVNVALLQALPQAAPADPLPPAPEAGLYEPGPAGPLPKVDGRRAPWQVYARPAPAAAGPKVAIVLGGLGLSGFVTRQAIEAMPPDVTVALDAYGRDVAALGLMARAQGHETLVVAPLESNDFPFSDPGPLGWQVGQAAEENVRRLQTVLSRFAGYAGVQLDLQSRVADQSGALRPIAQILKARGLMVFHPGGVQGAGAVVLRDLRLPVAAADVVIDEQPNDAAIAQRLADLEARARANPGGAVGFARPYPATLMRLGPWLGTLKAKGITLVPLTALTREGAS